MILNNEMIKKYACHLKTMGAYVQEPIPRITGLDMYQVISSLDAKSLYPTIMVLSNIGYDTLYGRIYDDIIIEKLLSFLISSFNEKDKMKLAIGGFETAISNMVKSYSKSEDIQNKKEFLEFTVGYYSKLFEVLISYPGKLEDIFEPKDNDTYFLLKSCFFPLCEAITWMHQYNNGYNRTVVDYVFYNENFKDKYKNKKFYLFENINSTKTVFKTYNYEEMETKIFKRFLLNPYGTLFYTHDEKKSFEVDLILQGMDDRGFVKNQGLIIKAITNQWQNIKDDLKNGFKTNGKMEEIIAKEIINIVGDTNEKKRKSQLESLLSIDFNNQDLEEKEFFKKLKLLYEQKDSMSNGIKVTLNSGYGIYAMASWNYGNALIANSITNCGKIYGIKLGQQIASNVLEYIKDHPLG